MKAKPTRDLILVKSLPITKDLKVGMIHIPDIGKVAPRQGTVIAVGPKVTEIAEGDKVIFSKHSGSRITSVNPLDNSSYLIMRERDAIAVIG